MFDIPASKRSIKQNRFEFTLDGATYDVPLMQFLPVASAEAFEAGQQVRAFMLACDSDEAKDAVRSLDGEQFGAFVEAWQKASDVTVGESGASSSS